MAIYIDTDRTSNSYCMLKFTWSNRTLVHHVASQIARNGDIIEILDNLALLSLDARLAILYQLTDVRLRRLECEGTRPGEIYNERVGEFNVELQIMWSFHCETKRWTTHKHWLKYLHLLRNKKCVVMTWTKLTDQILKTKQEWESNHALRYFDPRRVYWENHFRQHVSRSHRNTLRDSEGIIDELDQFYENIITLVKLNSRDIDNYTLERIVRLKALQKIELHHPPNRDRILQDSSQTPIWSLFLQLLQHQRVVNQLGFYHGRLWNAQLVDLSIALSSRVEKFGPAAEISRFELVSIKLTDDCVSNDEPFSDCVTESNVVSTLCATIARLQFLKILRITNSFFICKRIGMKKVTAEIAYTAFHLPRLKVLCLEHADLSDKVLDKALRSLLFSATTQLCSIKSIHFGDNRITAQTLKMLGLIILTKGWKLKRLVLKGSMNIGDSGIPCLIPILANSGSCALEKLDLRNCGLGIDGARMLCTALEANHSVQRINISYNFLSPLFGDSLASLLQNNNTINALHCDYIGLTDVGCTDELILAIQNNLALNEITLGVNRLGDNGSTKVFDALVKRSLKKPYLKIDLSGNIITSLGLHKMQLALRQLLQNDFEFIDRVSTPSRKRARYSLNGTRSKPGTEFDMAHPANIEQLFLLDNRFADDDAINGDLSQIRRFIHVVKANEWKRIS